MLQWPLDRPALPAGDSEDQNDMKQSRPQSGLLTERRGLASLRRSAADGGRRPVKRAGERALLLLGKYAD